MATQSSAAVEPCTDVTVAAGVWIMGTPEEGKQWLENIAQ